MEEAFRRGELDGEEKARKEARESGFRVGVMTGLELGKAAGFIEGCKVIVSKMLNEKENLALTTNLVRNLQKVINKYEKLALTKENESALKNLQKILKISLVKVFKAIN